MKEAIIKILESPLSDNEKAEAIETLFDTRLSELQIKVGDLPDID